MSRPFSVEIPIRFRDCDPMRHVNNAAIATYFEIVRTDYYLARREGVGVGGMDFILARIEIDFASQASFGETIVASVRPSTLGESSFAFEYELREKETGRVVATGKTVQVCYDYTKGAKMPIPPKLRKALEADGGKPR